MPEGDTVYRSARNLDAALRGAVLTRCDIRVPAFATVDLTGGTVRSVASRGKHLLMRVGEYTLHSHLKMEGSWHLYRPGSKWFRPEFQARAILGTEDLLAVGFDLGLFDVVRTNHEDDVVGYLGPDLLGDWDPALAEANLRRDPDRAIGLALLDQRNLAGLGNVYRAELCFLRGVLPTRPVGEVPQLEKIVELAWRLIDANKDRPQRTTTGRLAGQRLWVYGRTGQPCFRCDTPIEHGELGDSALQLRDSWWCPRCQS
jgi:endonuclease-8